MGHLKRSNGRSGLRSHHMQKQTGDKVIISYLLLWTHCTEQQFAVVLSAFKLVMCWFVRKLVKPLKEMAWLVCIMDLENSVSLPKVSSSILFAHFPPPLSLLLHVVYTAAHVYPLRHSCEKKMFRWLGREA